MDFWIYTTSHTPDIHPISTFAVRCTSELRWSWIQAGIHVHHVCPPQLTLSCACAINSDTWNYAYWHCIFQSLQLEPGFILLRYPHDIYLLFPIPFAAWKQVLSMLRGGLGCLLQGAGKGYFGVTQLTN